MSEDEARFPMVPTLTATLGVKGHRPVVGTRDCKDLLYIFAVVNVVSAALHATIVESPKDATRKTGLSKNRRLQEGFAAHLRHVGRPVRRALADNPHLEMYRLPSYSPHMNVIERFWKLLRRRATHNRLFDSLADLKRSLRNSLRYFQTMRQRIASLVAGCYEPKTTQSSNS